MAATCRNMLRSANGCKTYETSTGNTSLASQVCSKLLAPCLAPPLQLTLDSCSRGTSAVSCSQLQLHPASPPLPDPFPPSYAGAKSRVTCLPLAFLDMACRAPRGHKNNEFANEPRISISQLDPLGGYIAGPLCERSSKKLSALAHLDCLDTITTIIFILIIYLSSSS